MAKYLKIPLKSIFEMGSNNIFTSSVIFISMNRGILIFLIFLISSFNKEEEKVVLRHRLIVQPASKLMILGKTNVNNFQCAIARYCGSDTLVLQEGGSPGKPISSAKFVARKSFGV